MPGFHSKSSQACDAKLFLFIVSSKGANDSQPLLQVNINKQDGQAEIGPKGEILMDKGSGSLEIKRFVSGLAAWRTAVRESWKILCQHIWQQAGCATWGSFTFNSSCPSCWGLPSGPLDPAAQHSSSQNRRKDKTNAASYPQHHLGPLTVKTHISRQVGYRPGPLSWTGQCVSPEDIAGLC